MIIIFNTACGLCNQIYDINCGINFCIIHNIKFTFQYCSFRNKNLVSWFDKDFYELFDISTILKKYKNLYIDSNTLNITKNNTYNFECKLAHLIFSNNFTNEIKNIKQDFVILKQFWSLYKFINIVDDLNSQIQPSKRIFYLYNTIKNNLLTQNEKYNFIHYRYESDFTNHFKVTIEPLKNIILRIKPKFKNPDLKIYIATSNIKSIINLNDFELCNIIFTKNEDNLSQYNFEELAFVDYMFGLNSNEVFGHSKSSFSHMLNGLKRTNNYYA